MKSCKKHPDSERRPSGKCKQCGREANASAAEQIAKWREKNPHKMKEYAAKRRAAPGYAAEVAEKSRAKRAENPEYSRLATRRSRDKRVGVDPVVAEAARRSHKGTCDCCGTRTPGGKGNWNMDHDHRTGQVRGILCFQCNIGIGKLGDTLEGVLLAVKYLQRGAKL